MVKKKCPFLFLLWITCSSLNPLWIVQFKWWKIFGGRTLYLVMVEQMGKLEIWRYVLKEKNVEPRVYRQLSLVWNFGWHVWEVSRLNEDTSESPISPHEEWNRGYHCPNYYESHGSDRGTLNQAWGPFNRATLWDRPGHTSMNPSLAFEAK